MDKQAIPNIAYIFIGISTFVLTYITMNSNNTSNTNEENKNEIVNQSTEEPEKSIFGTVTSLFENKNVQPEPTQSNSMFGMDRNEPAKIGGKKRKTKSYLKAQKKSKKTKRSIKLKK